MSHFKIKDLSRRMATVRRLHAAETSPRDIAEIVGMTAAHVRRCIAEDRKLEAADDFGSDPADDFGA